MCRGNQVAATSPVAPVDRKRYILCTPVDRSNDGADAPKHCAPARAVYATLVRMTGWPDDAAPDRDVMFDVGDPAAAGLTAADLTPFFVGWPTPPPPERRLEILRAADELVVARDPDGRLVGFVTALTDGTFAAFVPLLEVVPDRQGTGLGSRLVAALLDRLSDCYSVDLVCDPDVTPFSERLGGARLDGIGWRRYERLDP